MAKTPKEELSEEEVERRATDALRRALATPYKPQKELVGPRGKDKPGARRAGKRPVTKL